MIRMASVLWEKAAQREAVCSWRVLIAGIYIELHFTSAVLQSAYRPALEHLRVDDTDVAIAAQIFLWDAAAGVPLPSPPSGLTQLGPHGQILGLHAHEHATFQGHSGVWSAFDSESHTGFIAVRDAAKLPNYEIAAPMRTLLGWIGAYNGFVLAHGAAVGTSRGAALLVGRGGSGKSTTALSCLLEGLDFLGDDYVALRNDKNAGQPQVWSLFQSGKVSANSLALLPALENGVIRRPTSLEDDKFLVSPSNLKKASIAVTRPLLTIFLPVISQAEVTTILPASKAQAIAALAPSTVFQMAGFGSLTLAQLTQIVGELPAYTLNLGKDFKAPHLIKEHLEP